jgi:hypothetical protein
MATPKEYHPEILPKLLDEYCTSNIEVLTEVDRILDAYAKGHGYNSPTRSQDYFFLGITISKVNTYEYGPEDLRKDRAIKAFWYNPNAKDDRDRFLIEQIDMRSFTMTTEEIIELIQETKRQDEEKRKQQDLEYNKRRIENDHKTLERLMNQYPEVWKTLAK